MYRLTGRYSEFSMVVISLRHRDGASSLKCAATSRIFSSEHARSLMFHMNDLSLVVEHAPSRLYRAGQVALNTSRSPRRERYGFIAFRLRYASYVGDISRSFLCLASLILAID